jgi:hypothetical protein
MNKQLNALKRAIYVGRVAVTGVPGIFADVFVDQVPDFWHRNQGDLIP